MNFKSFCVSVFIMLTIIQQPSNLPKGFVYVKEVIPSIIVDLRYYSTNNFMGVKVNGYKSQKLILTKQATYKLKLVQQELLKNKMSLKVFDGYRPQKAVNHFVTWAKELKDTINKKEYYPFINKKFLFAKGYIATKSGHSRGSTIDVTIVDLESGNVLDMGSNFDFFGEISNTQNKNLSNKQQQNRRLLRDIMRKYDFVNYPKEWWHYTLKNEPFPNTYFTFNVE